MADHELRQHGIGGSDVAAILGCDSRRDAYSVWAEKTGRLRREPPTARMQLGKLFERGIVEYYSSLTGRAVVWLDQTRRDPERPWMVYTPDAICQHENRGIDAKLVSWDQRHLWGETADDIPERVQIQCHWYMAAMDYPVWDVAALLGMDEPRVYTIRRDYELEDEILQGAEEFWRRHIVGGEEPVPGGSPETSRYIRERFPRQRADIREASPVEAALLDEYRLVRDDEDDINLRRTALEQRIKLAIGEADGLTWAGGRFTWRNVRDSLRTDWEALAESMLRTMAADEQAALKREYSALHEGTRRINFQRAKAVTQ
jgi:predicted phage-related endonuclease